MSHNPVSQTSYLVYFLTPPVSVPPTPVSHNPVSPCLTLLCLSTSRSRVSVRQSNCSGPLRGLNEDTMGGVLKAGVAQFVALEISRGNSRESRAISRYLPWLYNPPSPVQQG